MTWSGRFHDPILGRDPVFADPWSRWPHGLSPILCDKV